MLKGKNMGGLKGKKKKEEKVIKKENEMGKVKFLEGLGKG
jgi:hypothetical protein